MTLCRWAQCARHATVELLGTRPCGHELPSPTPSCPGHAEMAAGPAPRDSACHRCGIRSHVTMRLLGRA